MNFHTRTAVLVAKLFPAPQEEASDTCSLLPEER